MTNPLICAISGEESVNAEMKSIFPSMQGTSATPTSCINEQSHEAVLSRADTLLKQLRSNPSATTIKNSRRRRKHVGKARDYQHNIVVVDYAGAKHPAVQVLHDYDKVYEGTLQFNSSMSEECIREEIARLIQQKKDSTFHDFSTITPKDFMFVKCVNRRIRIPYGKAVYDGDGIRELYRSANISHTTDKIIQ